MSEHHIHIHLMSEAKDDDRNNDFLREENAKLEAILRTRDAVITDLETRIRDIATKFFSVPKIQRTIEQVLKEKEYPFWQTTADHIIKRL